MKNIEIWKAYPEFPWVEVSQFGDVRTRDRWVPYRGKGKLFIKGRILKQQRRNNGYLQVEFSVNGKTINRSVHRLVAQTFIPNPDNFPDINHKYCNRTNNNIDNLEWCSRSYNQKYREKYGVSNTEALGHPVFAINLTTLEVSRFQSQMEASRVFGISYGNIVEIIKGKRKQSKGYWFTNDDSNAVESTRDKLGDKVAEKVDELMKREDKVEQ